MSTHVPQRHSILVDWLRFLAAFGVLLRHTRPDHWVAYSHLQPESQGPATWIFFLLLKICHESVVIFFVLSGYLVGGKVIRDCANKRFNPGDFFRDRTTRLYIPLIPALVLTAACVAYLQSGLPEGYWFQWFGNVFYLQGILIKPVEGNPSLWTLAYEMWFYVLAGSVGMIASQFFVPTSLRRFVFAIGLALFSGWCLAVLDTSYFFCWLMGAIASISPLKELKRSGLIVGLVFIATGTLLTEPSLRSLLPGSLDPVVFGKLGNMMVGIAIAFWLPCLQRLGDRMDGNRFIKWGTPLAAFSYTLYLTHYPLLLVMRTWHEPFDSLSTGTLLLYCVKLVICLMVAWIFYLMFERHTTDVRNWVKKMWRQGAAH